MRNRDAVLVLTAFLPLAISGVAAQTPATPAPPAPAVSRATVTIDALPSSARDTLDDAWKGWQLAEIPRAGTDTCADAAKDGASPSLVTGDFDADGFRDYALQIVAGGHPHVIVLRGRLQGFSIYELQTPSIDPGTGGLRVAAPGTPFHDPTTGLEDYFMVDTIELSHCGGASLSYRWTGVSFEPAPASGGSRVPAPPRD